MELRRTVCGMVAALALGAVALGTTELAAKSDPVPVKIEKPQAWQGVNQVVIGQFSVVFMTKKVDYDGGGFLSTSDKAKATGYLTGLSEADYQKITDAVYADFLTQMKDHGVAVLDDAGMEADPYFAKVKPEKSGEKADIQLKKNDHGDGLTYWPSQLGRNTNALLNFRIMDRNMVNAYTGEYNYAKTAKVPVLNVVYYIDFAKPASTSGGGLLQSVKVTSGLALSQFGSQFALMGIDGKLTRMLLQTPIEEGGDFATITETTSGLQKGMHVANILGAGVFGGKHGTMNTKFDYRVTDPASYAAKTLLVTSRGSDLFIRQMEGMR
ncbi:MAG: hypothetical protein IT549_09770 [Novosphingobium sp.]|nr:hypothetical protein [Novosphingobium sp.]